ncbi:MAG: ECF transporter S component [Lachnospiraceae bacterium]|nr:ECF transporter S component [Lachnospiraceae bacterium]
MTKQKFGARTIAGLAILTAVVVVLQMLGSFIRFGPFSISLVLIPIVVGAALYGPLAGAWLGFVFSVVVLINDAAAFLAINIPGTVITVLLKGTLAGFLSGIVYNLLKKWALVFKNLEKDKESWQINLGVVVAAIVCPVVNTGIFLLGCVIFFLPTIREWGAAAGYENVGAYMLYGFVGGNFLFELLFNLILSPVIVQIIRIGQRSVKK